LSPTQGVALGYQISRLWRYCAESEIEVHDALLYRYGKDFFEFPRHLAKFEAVGENPQGERLAS
jgi:hypothetical protein